ncbi:type II toxin-antitoxin system HipA family toxin [Thiomonas sp. FB-6]|uniref:type II toxin-antitoxin system HipA family toxin n=1 Tax=Thiomonas sp. FB-6 TaxID=1158291 RepID=UPI000476D1DE|nr:type II toxin-antitoxin system HipA family toxin [Thiomonas sp. FB-6]
MAGRPSLSRSQRLWMNGEPVARWTLTARRDHELLYDAAWLQNPRRRALSLSLPLQERPHRGEVVANYFGNLLPDTLAVRKALARRHHATADEFSLLEAIGRDCVGAVQLLPEGQEPSGVRGVQCEALREGEVEALLSRAQTSASWVADDEEDELRISLAGAQDKTALLWHEQRWCRPLGATPTTHILKLPVGKVGRVQADFTTSVDNEWLCNRVLNALGLPVPAVSIQRFGRHRVLVVERFDRRWQAEGWWARLPQEDFCQVYGIASDHKYETNGGPSLQRIVQTLRGSVHAVEDRNRVFLAQVLFWVLAAPDGHGKNFSIFLLPDGAFRLTPLYDVLSAWPVVGKGAHHFSWNKLKLAMAVHAQSNHYLMRGLQRRHFNEAARRLELGADFEDPLCNLVRELPRAFEQVREDLPSDFAMSVFDALHAGALAQCEKLYTS